MKFKTKTKALLVSVLVIACLAGGATLAFLTSSTNQVTNEMTPGVVTTEVDETFVNNVKSKVSIKNTGNIRAFIRAEVVVTWKDEYGNVYGQKPVAGTDYTISYNISDSPSGAHWFEKDGFYYWSNSVEPNATTGVLINSVSPVAGRTPAGYYLNVEILGSGIQADGVSNTAATGNKGEAAAKIAWNVTVNSNGTISK